MPAVPSNALTKSTVETASLTAEMDTYLQQFQQYSLECIDNAYRIHRAIERSAKTGTLTTSIAQDIVTLLDTQFRTLSTYFVQHDITGTLPDVDTAVAGFWQTVLRQITHNQRSMRPIFMYQAVDECCAAANDFLAMSDQLDRLLQSWITHASHKKGPLGTKAIQICQEDGATVVAGLVQDAVQAAEHVQVILMRKVNRTSIASDLFSRSWEDDWTHNEVVTELIQIFDVELGRIQTFLSAEHLYHKTFTACCKAVVCFYIRCLVQKADSVSFRRRNRDRLGRIGERQPFRTPERALRRMKDDIGLIQDFFLQKSKSGSGTVVLTRICGEEMRILELIYECLTSEDGDSMETFIVVIHRRTGADALVTQHFVSDLWLLVQREEYGGQLREAITTLEPDLRMVSAGVKELNASLPVDHSFVRVDQMLKMLYEDRIAQGLLPVCWTCLPKSGEEGTEVVANRIRAISRKLVELPRKLREEALKGPSKVELPRRFPEEDSGSTRAEI